VPATYYLAALLVGAIVSYAVGLAARALRRRLGFHRAVGFALALFAGLVAAFATPGWLGYPSGLFRELPRGEVLVFAAGAATLAAAVAAWQSRGARGDSRESQVERRDVSGRDDR
jgi:hypothetical protein